jgi:hypothetical protein
VGMVLLLVVALGHRIQVESFELLGARVKVRDLVNDRVRLAELAGSEGKGDRSDAIRGQALALQKLVALYDLYSYVRSTEPVSFERTAYLDELASRMRAAVEEGHFDSAEISTWFREGSDALRVIALNVMLAREDCRDLMAVLKAVGRPRSNFEQYYGLWLGREMLPGLQMLERGLLARAIGQARRKRRFRRDGPLMDLADDILGQMAAFDRSLVKHGTPADGTTAAS